jgi:tryptophan halogenase
VLPDGYHPLADQLSADDLRGFLDTTRRAVAASVAAMPGHADFIARHCPARQPLTGASA